MTTRWLMAARDNKLYFHKGGNPAHYEKEYSDGGGRSRVDLWR